MMYRICLAGVSLLLVALLSACQGTRIPLANRPAPEDQALRQVSIDLDGIPESCLKLECEEKEEDPCGHKHLASVFLGYSRVGNEDGATFGLEYGYRVREDVTVGAFLDLATGDLRDGAFGAGVFLRPTEELFFMIGPGVHISTHDENKAMLRLGTGYEYEVSRNWFVSPAAYLDIIDGLDPVIVIGLNFGRSWR